MFEEIFLLAGAPSAKPKPSFPTSLGSIKAA